MVYLQISVEYKLETRPALGPKVLIVSARKSPSSFGEAITSSSKNDAHRTAPTAARIRPIAVPGHNTLSRDNMHTVRYGIVSTLRCDSQNVTLKYCTVQCALKVIITREES